METFAAKVTALLKEKCSHSGQLSSFMGQPVITVEPKNVGELEELQTEIKELIESQFPDRDEDIMITIRRNGMEDTGFRVWKSKHT
ncbi:hypothetical protein LLH06_10695 [Mucilaginibacter daejeonensis]|uniref:hypothetical protein n=1 Tax=Mucilaginibacter daejeonensis TaxID=398049 RepID=UPI001D1797A3|nr:hypothetical protein [Mucilaginibacter daejeonensis]UEG51441.1 hypothetical protein LLH06_10695 [Mucilaginibacter daejeonensis]